MREGAAGFGPAANNPDKLAPDDLAASLTHDKLGRLLTEFSRLLDAEGTPYTAALVREAVSRLPDDPT